MPSLTASFAHGALFVLTLSVAGCGGKSFSNDHDDVNGGSSSGGASSHGGVSSAGAGVAGAPQCNGFADDEPGHPVTVRLTNGTMGPLYVGSQTRGCGLGQLFQVTKVSGPAQPLQPLSPLQFCSSTCAQLQSGEPIGCPPLPCIVSSVTTLQPGAAFEQLWSGQFLADRSLPSECRPAYVDAACSQIRTAQPGVFVFDAVAGLKQDCSAFSPDGACSTCLPDNNGGCTTYGAIIAPPLLTAQLKLELDESYGVGAANDDDDRKTLPVELVFRE